MQFWTHGTSHTPGSGSYNLSWGFNWTGPSTPLGSAFIDPTPCPRVYCGSSYATFDIDLLADAGGGTSALVSLRGARTVSQYGYSISESGSVLPAGGSAAGYLMVKAVPEPGTYALVGIGLAGAAAVARRRRSEA